MRASKRGELPKDLLRGRSRFQAWRQRRKTRGRIPDALWALAIRLVKVHGINRTALALGVDYYCLKKRAEAASMCEPPSSCPAFVELPATALVGKQCLFEVNNAAGVTLRVQLLGYDTADVETLARAVWSAK
ncbi:MAG TPA: hypothetical protein VG125_11715 [Pirellulales bacterium]|jgi:hypothetical protein|nr:hypothetical protein [Pirellulales bacterium]